MSSLRWGQVALDLQGLDIAALLVEAPACAVQLQFQCAGVAANGHGVQLGVELTHLRLGLAQAGIGELHRLPGVGGLHDGALVAGQKLVECRGGEGPVRPGEVENHHIGVAEGGGGQRMAQARREILIDIGLGAQPGAGAFHEARRMAQQPAFQHRHQRADHAWGR